MREDFVRSEHIDQVGLYAPRLNQSHELNAKVESQRQEVDRVDDEGFDVVGRERPAALNQIAEIDAGKDRYAEREQTVASAVEDDRAVAVLFQERIVGVVPQ